MQLNIFKTLQANLYITIKGLLIRTVFLLFVENNYTCFNFYFQFNQNELIVVLNSISLQLHLCFSGK